MKKSILIIEELGNSRKSNILNKIEKFFRLFEIITFILPSIPKLKKNSQLIVLSYDNEVLDYLKYFGIHGKLISEEFGRYEIEEMFKKSLELFDNSFQKMNDYEITFLGVNLCLVIQEDFTDLYFEVIKRIKLAHDIIEDISPISVYVDNAQSSIGQIFMEVAANKKINAKSIIPNFYSKSKNRIYKYLLHTRFRIPQIENIQAISCNSNSKQKLLAYVPYANFADAVSPVLIKLLEKELYQKIYIAGEVNNVFKDLKDSSKISISFKNRMKSKELKQVKKKFLSSLMDDSFHKIFRYDGINFWSVVKDDLFCFTQKRIKYIMLNLNECDLILNQTKPNIVLVGDERTPRIRTCVLLAKSKNIPVLEVQHGIYSIIRPKIPPVSDKVCVWGEYSKRNFINYIDASNQIIVTGCPKFDQLIKKGDNKSLIMTRKTYKNILFTTQYGFEDTTTLVIEKIISFLNIEKNIYLTIKPHPAEKKEQYYKFAKKSPKVILEEPRANTDDLLIEADVLVTISSSVGINAAILSIPILLINLNNKISPYSSISLEVRDIEEIMPSLKSVLYDNTILQRMKYVREEFAYEHAYVKDGKASERVINVILNLTNRDELRVPSE